LCELLLLREEIARTRSHRERLLSRGDSRLASLLSLNKDVKQEPPDPPKDPWTLTRDVARLMLGAERAFPWV